MRQIGFVLTALIVMGAAQVQFVHHASADQIAPTKGGDEGGAAAVDSACCGDKGSTFSLNYNKSGCLSVSHGMPHAAAPSDAIPGGDGTLWIVNNCSVPIEFSFCTTEGDKYFDCQPNYSTVLAPEPSYGQGAWQVGPNKVEPLGVNARSRLVWFGCESKPPYPTPYITSIEPAMGTCFQSRSNRQQAPLGQSKADPSFDCSKAKTADEIAICGDSAIADLDRKAATRWGDLKAVDADAARRIGREFLRMRRACGADTSCIRAAQERVMDAYREALWDAEDVPGSTRVRLRNPAASLPDPSPEPPPPERPRQTLQRPVANQDDSFGLPPLKGGYLAHGTGAGPSRHDAIGNAILSALANTFAGEGNRTPSGLQVDSCSPNGGGWQCNVQVSYLRIPGAARWSP